MNPSQTLSQPTLELTLTRFESPLEVDMERFFEFSFDLAEDLLDMEARFATKDLSGNRITPSRRA